MNAPIEHPSLYDELLDLLAGDRSPQHILNFKASADVQTRVDELLEKNRSQNLSPDESSELDEYERLEHLVRMLKARVRQKLKA